MTVKFPISLYRAIPVAPEARYRLEIQVPENTQQINLVTGDPQVAKFLALYLIVTEPGSLSMYRFEDEFIFRLSLPGDDLMPRLVIIQYFLDNLALPNVPDKFLRTAKGGVLVGNVSRIEILTSGTPDDQRNAEFLAQVWQLFQSNARPGR